MACDLLDLTLEIEVVEEGDFAVQDEKWKEFWASFTAQVLAKTQEEQE